MSWPGIDWVVALQGLSPALDGLARGLSFFGDEVFFSAFVPFLYWCVDVPLGLRVMALLVGSTFLNGVVKLGAHAPRPYWVDARVKALSLESSYGLPSGHAQTAMAVWPAIARALGTPWARAGAALVVLGISLSRVYLGVHFPQDVLAGWAIGGLLLLLYPAVRPRAVRWFAARRLAAQIAAAFALSMVMLAIVLGARAALAGRADPPEWAARAAAGRPAASARQAYDPRGLDGAVTDAGVAFGAIAGVALMLRHAPFRAGGPWAKRAARFFLGLAVVAALRFGLAAVFPREPLVIALIFRYVRYAVTAAALAWLAPWLFIKSGLAEGATES
jgi:membrane-associated phospholipid phosphatase